MPRWPLRTTSFSFILILPVFVMESLYSVVHFINDNTVEGVLSNWIKHNTCAWPYNKKHARKMIEQKYQPNNKEFTFFKIRMLCSGIKTLAEARFKAKKAELTSDLSDDDNKKKRIKLNKFSSTKSVECPIYNSDSDGNGSSTMCKANKKMQMNQLKKNGWSPSPRKIEGAESTSFKRKLTFGVDNFKRNANHPGAEKSPLLKRNSLEENNHTQTSLFSPFMIKSDNSGAEKSPLLKRNSFDENNHTQTSLFSPFMIKSDNSDAEKCPLLRRNSFEENNHTQTLFSPVMINSDNDEAEGTSFFNMKFGTDNSKEKRNQLENIRYISPRKSPDFSNDVVSCDLEKSTGRKSYSLCKDHDAIDDKEFKKQIIRHIMYFKVELKYITNTLTNNHYELLERMQSIEKFLEDKPTKFYEQTNVDINCMSDCSMPIDNIVDLNTLEDKTLGDQEFKNALINELSHVGGKNVKTTVKRIMSKLFTNCFLAEYSFTGKKGKKKFCDLFIFPIILKSIKKQVKFKNASDHEIEEPLKVYLAQAPFADKRSKAQKI